MFLILILLSSKNFLKSAFIKKQSFQISRLVSKEHSLINICDPGAQNQSQVAGVYLQQPQIHCMGQNDTFFFYAKKLEDIK